jgi:hypothetical protein
VKKALMARGGDRLPAPLSTLNRSVQNTGGMPGRGWNSARPGVTKVIVEAELKKVIVVVNVAGFVHQRLVAGRSFRSHLLVAYSL